MSDYGYWVMKSDLTFRSLFFWWENKFLRKKIACVRRPRRFHEIPSRTPLLQDKHASGLHKILHLEATEVHAAR